MAATSCLGFAVDRMPRTMHDGDRSERVNSLDDVRPKAARAALPVNRSQRAMTAVVKDALVGHYGSFKAAAYAMGEMDEGQLSRELENGKFKFERLDLCDDDAKQAVTKALHDAYGSTDPQARVRRLIRTLRAGLDELDEAISA